jgi:uroporphyrinogen-III synthase
MLLAGFKVVSFESRRAEVVEHLIRQHGGQCFNAPSVRERPIERDEECLRFVGDVIRGDYEAVVFTTGVGAQYIIDAASALGRKQPFLQALGRTKTVCRGPKPAAVLRPLGVPVALNVPEPNTWRETADAMKDLPVKSVAVQEYGVPNPELIALLRERKMEVTPVPVYRWDLPEDTSALERVVQGIANHEFDIALFLSSVQLTHVLQIAGRLNLRDELLRVLRERIVVVSIGPVMTDALVREEITPDFTPKHPKLAICVRQLAQEAASLVARKRRVVR